MIGVDTNVFLRFSLDEDKRQHAAALALLASASAEKPLYVHPIVWLEAEWLLRSRYKLSRQEIAERLALSVRADQIVMPETEACEAALEDYRANKADLADCLLARLNAFGNCAETLTFDKDASRLEGMRLLKT